jgi:hypothetical protein
MRMMFSGLFILILRTRRIKMNRCTTCISGLRLICILRVRRIKMKIIRSGIILLFEDKIEHDFLDQFFIIIFFSVFSFCCFF